MSAAGRALREGEGEADCAGEAAGAYRLDDQVGYLMRLAAQRHGAIFQALITEGLTPPQFAVLHRLAECGATSQNQLGRLVALDAATVKGVVDRLAGKGLVCLAPAADDARLRLVSLTDMGRALLPQLEACGRAITGATLAPLTVRERDTLLRLLRKLT